MSTFAPLIEGMLATLRGVVPPEAFTPSGIYADLDITTLCAILEQASAFAARHLAPIDAAGDQAGAVFCGSAVAMPPGWSAAYEAWRQAGWQALSGAVDFGGQGLPVIAGVLCGEIWHGASTAFALMPMLTMAAAEAIQVHASDDLKARYLPDLIQGRCAGTMNLTEPDAGSDLSRTRSRAVPEGDGTYRIAGEKIFISYGEHDLTPNIVHLVLARLPDGAPGTRGLSLFLVPKILPDGRRNDIRCTGIERKLGLHASPTCTMVYGENGGAIGWLIGEENVGLASMFTMMNNARLNVGVQGYAVGAQALQEALAYAGERRQGRRAGATTQTAIVDHPDIRRTLIGMRARLAACRAIAHLTAYETDRSNRAADSEERRQARDRASFMTPILKSYATDVGFAATNEAIQVHGGMGFVEATGIARHMRDIRAAAIYEGTNGIQAIDFVSRKLRIGDGRILGQLMAEYAATAQLLSLLSDAAAHDAGATLTTLIETAGEASRFMGDAIERDADLALGVAADFLRGHAVLLGSHLLARIFLQTEGPSFATCAGGDLCAYLAVDGRAAISIFANIAQTAQTLNRISLAR